VRAMLWTALALPVRMMKGKWPETALAIGLIRHIPACVRMS